MPRTLRTRNLLVCALCVAGCAGKPETVPPPPVAKVHAEAPVVAATMAPVTPRTAAGPYQDMKAQLDAKLHELSLEEAKLHREAADLRQQIGAHQVQLRQARDAGLRMEQQLEMGNAQARARVQQELAHLERRRQDISARLAEAGDRLVACNARLDRLTRYQLKLSDVELALDDWQAAGAPADAHADLRELLNAALAEAWFVEVVKPDPAPFKRAPAEPLRVASPLHDDDEIVLEVATVELSAHEIARRGRVEILPPSSPEPQPARTPAPEGATLMARTQTASAALSEMAQGSMTDDPEMEHAVADLLELRAVESQKHHTQRRHSDIARKVRKPLGGR